MDLPAAERDQLLEGVVRALSVAEARPSAAATLLDIFPRTSGPVQWVVGNAIEITASPAQADRVLDIVQDGSYGSSRQMLVLVLRRIAKRNPRTIETLERLIDDDSVAPQAMTVLASLRPDLALRLARPKVDSADPAIGAAARKAVKLASAKLDKAQ